MATVSIRLAPLVGVVLLLSCGGAPPEPAAGGNPPPPGSTAAASTEAGRACELLDLAAARTVIGSAAELPGDPERDTCMYVNPGVAMLTIQLSNRAYFDQVTIMQPYTAAAIGDEGRHNVQPSGVAAVQFAKGDHSATISVQPMGSSPPAYLDPLLSVAQQVANRLP